MKCEWKTLDSLDISVIDGDRGKNYPHKTELLASGNCLFLSAQNVTKNGFVFNDCQFISPEKDSALRNGKLVRNDIVITTRGTVGNVAYYDSNILYENMRINSGMLIIRCNKDINSEYLYYILKSEWFLRQIKAIQTGSAQPQLPKAHFLKMVIPFIPLTSQKKIASVLSAIDDKIALNQRINDNLEQQAQAIFEDILSSGGEMCCVSDIAVLNPRRTLVKNGVARCIDMSKLSTSGSVPDSWEFKPFNGGMKFTNGDTIMARITPCLENGKAGFINFLEANEVAFGSTEYIVLSPQNNTPPEFLYCLVRYPAFVDYAVKNMNGSSGRQRVSAETIGKFEIPSISSEQFSEFSNAVSAMFEVIRNNAMQNARLATLRDTLLPRLMSGEIDVSEVETPLSTSGF